MLGYPQNLNLSFYALAHIYIRRCQRYAPYYIILKITRCQRDKRRLDSPPPVTFF